MVSAALKHSFQVTSQIVLTALLLVGPSTFGASAQELIRLPFPYGPLGLNSIPWVIAKEARLCESNGLNVEMVYVGASAVIVQSMLSGSANMAGFGGPAVITNVLQGGDIIQVAALIPHFTQSLLVRSDVRDLHSLQGKKLGITRFGSVTDFAVKTLLERHGLKDVHVLQMGGFPEAVAALARGAIDGAVLSPPHTFRMAKEGFRELITPADLRALGSGFLTQGIVARRSYATASRDVVLRLIKATMEAIRYATANEASTKRLIGKYLGVSDAELLRRSYQYVIESFVKEPFVPESTMRSMAQRMAQLNMIDANAAQRIPPSAYLDNSFVGELKQSGFLAALWK
jgi:ABC-type nitrate/sulfonate/bicarbonate transport system substrate-binding protein